MNRSGRRRLSLSILLCTLVWAIVMVGSTIVPGIAQPQSPGSEVAPPVVFEALARAGLSNPSNVRKRGPNFTANAVTRTGAPVKLVIQGSTGAIIGFRLITPNDTGTNAVPLPR